MQLGQKSRLLLGVGFPDEGPMTLLLREGQQLTSQATMIDHLRTDTGDLVKMATVWLSHPGQHLLKVI